MRKMLAVLKREYLSAVRKKMFIFMTLFFPVLMSAAMLVPTYLIGRSLGGKKVAVVDGTGELRDAFTNGATASMIPVKPAMRNWKRKPTQKSMGVL